MKFVNKRDSRGRESFICHIQRPVIRESAKTTKLRIVYDASSKPIKNSASLNDYLETGPSLQDSLWDILVRPRFKPIFVMR